MPNNNVQAAQLKKQTVPFTQVPNEILNRPDLTFALKGLFSYIQSKPEGWQFSAFRIAKDTHESESTIKRMLAKLIKLGYLIREKHSSGRVTYCILLEPKCQNATVVKCHGADLAPISNTESLSNTEEISNKERNKESFLSQNMYRLFNSCKKPNKATKEKYKHFINYVKIHDNSWKQKHRPYEKDEILRCEQFLNILSTYTGLAETDIVDYMEEYQTVNTNSDRFCTIFCHWIYAQVGEDDYRGFTGEGDKIQLSELIDHMNEYMEEG